MKMQSKMLVLVAAIAMSAGAIVPTTGVSAQITVRNDHRPLIEGSGRIVRQSRAVAGFHRIETLGAATVHVRLGGAPSLVISADDNVLPLLTSEVKNGTLTIGSRGSYRIKSPVRVWITAPDLDSYRTAGSGDVTIDGVNNGHLALAIQGSGAMRATGRTRRLDLAIHGSGNADLAQLASAEASAGLFGSGRATVNVSGRLNARVVGSGDLRYLGRPRQIDQHRIGSGRISAIAR